jgi:2-dehydropantoate 2-reductase
LNAERQILSGHLIIGAGSVGLSLAARLSRSGKNVFLLTHSPEQAKTINAYGINVEELSSGEIWNTKVQAFSRYHDLVDYCQNCWTHICVRLSDTEAVCSGLAEVLPQNPTISVQNGVDNDAILHKYFQFSMGLVWRQTCTRLDLNSVIFQGAGRLVLGQPYSDYDCTDLLEDLRHAGFNCSQTQDLQADRWLKMALNLLSAPSALLAEEHQQHESLLRLKIALLQEAAAVLKAAGIRAESCDSQDPSIEEMIAQVKSNSTKSSIRKRRVFNSVWTALKYGQELEPYYYYRRLVELGQRFKVLTPVNKNILEYIESLKDKENYPGRMTLSELEMLICGTV